MQPFRLKFCTFVLLLAACSRETPAPPAAPATAPPPASVAASPPPASAAPAQGSYEDGINWLRSASGYSFTIREGEARASGEMQRRTVGAESVTFRSGDGEWRAAATPSGVAWEKRTGTSWVKSDAPAWGSRLYQRVTLAFDPQKKEGRAQLVATEGGVSHYRFTDANSGNVHDVWIDAAGRVQRITIGDDVELTVTAGS